MHLTYFKVEFKTATHRYTMLEAVNTIMGITGEEIQISVLVKTKTWIVLLEQSAPEKGGVYVAQISTWIRSLGSPVFASVHAGAQPAPPRGNLSVCSCRRRAFPLHCLVGIFWPEPRTAQERVEPTSSPYWNA